MEIAGRSLLVAHLVADGIEVAEPLRDRGVDLLAYLDLDDADRFLAAPVQLKAFTNAGSGLDRKYERFPGLLLAYVWSVETPTEAVAYCLTYEQALGIADELGWTQTKSWTDKGVYVSTRPSKRLKALLDLYRMNPGSWIVKLREATAAPASEKSTGAI